MIDATILKTKLQKLVLKNRLRKIFLTLSEGKILVNYIGAANDNQSSLAEFFLLLIKQDLSIIERAALKAALYADVKGIKTQLLDGVSKIQHAIISKNVLPILISTDGKIYDKDKNEVDLSPLFYEVQKYLPTDDGRVGEEE